VTVVEIDDGKLAPGEPVLGRGILQIEGRRFVEQEAVGDTVSVHGDLHAVNNPPKIARDRGDSGADGNYRLGQFALTRCPNMVATRSNAQFLPTSLPPGPGILIVLAGIDHAVLAATTYPLSQVVENRPPGSTPEGRFLSGRAERI
jgi:hypothetical protein